MSDIVEIKPEVDWRKYEHEDVPAEPKPNNLITGSWAKGITSAVKELINESAKPSYIPTLLNGAVNYSPNFEQLNIKRIGKMRVMSGVIDTRNSTDKIVTQVATVDRPHKHVMFTVYPSDSSVNKAYGMINSTSGNVELFPYKSNFIGINVTWFVD